MSSPRHQLVDLIERGVIPAAKIADALAVALVTPGGKAWKVFIDRLLLWLGGLALAFAAMFFIAYNWNEIGRFAKFAMVEAAIVLAIVAYWMLAARGVAGKVALLAATILLGVLLALYGQTYQTGADPWQLFFTWALLMLPWAVIGRFAAIWIVWIALINLSIVLYHDTFGHVLWLMIGGDAAMYWLLFLFNTLALIVWEFLSNRWRWLSERWAIRLIAVGSGVAITWLVMRDIFDDRHGGVLSALIWAAWMAGLYWAYRKVRPDLFMLAGVCLSGIVVIVSFLGELILDGGFAGGYLLMAMVVIGLGAGSAIWLRNVHRELQS